MVRVMNSADGPRAAGPLAGFALADLAAWEGVRSAYAGTLDGIDAVLRDRGQRRTSPEQTADSLLRGAVASATLAGSTSGGDRIRAEGGDDIARAAVRVSAEVLGQVPTFRAAPLQALARLHALAAAGEVGAESLGRPRSPESAARLQALARRLQQDAAGRHPTPGLIVAAVVHAELATARPFGRHDDLVARAAERLVLSARGVDPRSLLAVEAGHLALRPAYESNLRGYATGGEAAVHAWLLYAAEAYAAAAEEASRVLAG